MGLFYHNQCVASRCQGYADQNRTLSVRFAHVPLRPSKFGNREIEMKTSGETIAPKPIAN